MTEYQWDRYEAQEAGVTAAFRLYSKWPYPQAIGFLKKGGRKRPGWYVHTRLYTPAILRLQPTLSKGEAQNAAKLILLSLKNTGIEEGQS